MTQEEAKRRFFTLQFVRLFGLGLVMFGALNAAGKVLTDYGPVLGYVSIVAGLIDYFFAPIVLKRLWSKPDQ